MIHSSMKTTIDVARQTRKFYVHANLLLRNFKHCSVQVKCVLFETYCCQLWLNSTKSSLTLYDPGGGGFKSPPPLRFFALTHLVLELHYCALVTFPKK